MPSIFRAPGKGHGESTSRGKRTATRTIYDGKENGIATLIRFNCHQSTTNEFYKLYLYLQICYARHSLSKHVGNEPK